MKTINARAMMEGSILAALTAIIGIFYNVPVVGAITLFWSVPIVIVGYRNGFQVSLIAAFIAAVLVSLVVTPIVGLILFVTFALPGAIMGYMIRNQFSIYRTLFVCGLILSITIVLECVLSLQVILGINIIDILGNLKASIISFNNILNNKIAEAAGMYKQFGLDEANVQQMINNFNVLKSQAFLLLPAGVVTAGMAICYLNFKVVKLILERAGNKIEDIKKFSEWHFSKKYRYLLLGITFIVLLLMTSPNQPLYEIYVNIWVIIQTIYVMFGLSVLMYFKGKLGEKYNIAKPVQNLIIILIILFMVMARSLPYIGIFEIAADIRRFDRNIPGGAK